MSGTTHTNPQHWIFRLFLRTQRPWSIQYTLLFTLSSFTISGCYHHLIFNVVSPRQYLGDGDVSKPDSYWFPPPPPVCLTLIFCLTLLSLSLWLNLSGMYNFIVRSFLFRWFDICSGDWYWPLKPAYSLSRYCHSLGRIRSLENFLYKIFKF